MVDRDWFVDLPEDFEESVRIDRDEADHREQAIQSYHLTDDSRRFISDFVDRMVGEADDMRTGSNYWLYGYYGSGKSHLLTVLDGLLDTDWLTGRQEEVWSALDVPTDAEEHPIVRDRWQEIHDEQEVIPISINLLKYQGQKQRSFSEVILRHAHADPDLTGIEGEISSGLSGQLDVAYFEKWLQTTDAWESRQTRANEILQDISASSDSFDWETERTWADIQRYGALADVVLPELFAEVNGIRDGYEDLVPSDIDPDEVVNRLNVLRRQREAELGEPVKLVLLLDEVSLFIGTDFGRLTELQTLAENIDEVQEDNIQLVVTAQADIEDVQPQFAAHGADFTILKDRFPHRYQLPSKHVGEIGKRRLLEKSPMGMEAVEDTLEQASVVPTESLVYSEIKQNTKPPLGTVDQEELLEFYPFLPYHAPLFLEILFNLRQEANDPAKSIFSGTARAILALMHNLLQRWVRSGQPDQVISLVDFYEQIEPELREILPQDMRVIEGATDASTRDLQNDEGELDANHGIADEVRDGDLEEFDLRVAKAILMLQHVHDIVPLNEGNIAVSVMTDLDGESWIRTQNRVEESLNRLQKFIRPNQNESGAKYRFATHLERLIYNQTEANEADPDWDAVMGSLDEHLWSDLLRELSLPESVAYDDSSPEYPVEYAFAFDGNEFETGPDVQGGLDVSIEYQGLMPGAEQQNKDASTLYWSINTDGLDDLRNHLIRWWALQDAVSEYSEPSAVKRDLDNRAEAVIRKLVSAIQGGSYRVKDQTDPGSVRDAVNETVAARYSDDWHPEMLLVSEERLQELANLQGEEPLPNWAHTIQVPESDIGGGQSSKTIQRNVLSLTGRQLQDAENGLSISTVLDGIVSEKPQYNETRAALCAILWGFCRKGRLVPVNEEGKTLPGERVLDSGRRQTTRLKLLPPQPTGNLLEEAGFKGTTETIADGLIHLQEANERLRISIRGLKEDVKLVLESDIHTPEITALLEGFRDELASFLDDTIQRVAASQSPEDGLEQTIEATNEADNRLKEISDVWNRRLANLYAFDAQLSIANSDFEWVDETAQTAMDSQRAALDGSEYQWWTTNGWKSLVSDTVPDVESKIQAAWEGSDRCQQMKAIVDEIQAHSWIVPPTDLSADVQPAFERHYITPLRRLQRWYSTVSACVIDLDSNDQERLVSIAEEIASTKPFTRLLDVDLAEVEARLGQLNTAVGSRTPADVDKIGIVPDDREALDRRIHSLIQDREVETEVVESGVIIR
jgi:hypothetical protein